MSILDRLMIIIANLAILEGRGRRLRYPRLTLVPKSKERKE